MAHPIVLNYDRAAVTEDRLPRLGGIREMPGILITIKAIAAGTVKICMLVGKSILQSEGRSHEYRT